MYKGEFTMKKLFIGLIVLLLCLTACNNTPSAKLPHGGKGSSLYQTLQSAGNMDGGAGAMQLVADAYKARPDVIYKDTVFLQLKATDQDPTGDRIVALSASEHKATPVFNGTTVGLFGGVLVASDKEGCHALDLEKGKSWVTLTAETMIYDAFSHNGQLYLLALSENTTKVITADLTTLKATEKALSAVYLPMEVIDGKVYYVTAEGALAAADPAIAEPTVLFTPEKYPLTALQASGSCLLLRDRYGHTHLYHPATAQRINLSERHGGQRAELLCETKENLLKLTLPNGSAVYYDTQTGQETTPAQPFDTWFPIPGGSYSVSDTAEIPEATVTHGDRTLPLSFRETPFVLQAGSDCGFFRESDAVTVIHWETEKQQVYKFADLQD